MINYDLTQIRALAFDVDGVLSAETISMDPDGVPQRTVNIKDGYALQLAVKMGLEVCIITGARLASVRHRYEGLGIKEVHIGASVKINIYEDWLRRHDLRDEEVLYMGDDIPDLEVLRRVGCPCCPADACPEVQEACIYISDRRGGYGCGRDVIEQVMRAKGLWMKDKKAFGW